MSDPIPATAPATTSAVSSWLHAGYDELKTFALGFVVATAVFGHLVVTPTPTPSPGPAPTPVPAPPSPTPIVPPVPEWGPLAKILVLYESSTLTGKEVFYSQPVRAALDQAAPADASLVPLWRIWDKDVDASREPTWGDALTKAKADFAAIKGVLATAVGASQDPVLYAFDAKGQMKSVPLKGLSDADAAAKIKALGGK